MKNYLLPIFLLLFISSTFAQEKYFTKTGRIVFSSKAPMETIEAKNTTALAVIDTRTGNLQFSIQMKSFEFEKALMQEHFNENYVESDQFPKAEFKGAITNSKEINFKKDGTYPAKIKGKLTLHGVTRDVETSALLKVSGNKINSTASFSIMLSDYRISIPSLVKDKVSNAVAIVVDCNFEPLK
jgi:polyisoprenoid-binding protein YceI